MRVSLASLVPLAALSAGLVLTAPTAFAQKADKKADKKEAEKKEAEKKEEKAEEKADAKKDEKSDETASKTDETDAKPAAATPPPPPADAHDPAEEKDKTYYYVGARFRQTLLPHFMFTPFVDGGPSSVWIPAFGIEGSMRRNGFDTVVFITYSDWSMDPFAFKGKDEAFTAWEIVTSKLKLIDVGVDLLWNADMSKYAAFQYGITTGIAVVFGQLKRVQGQPVPQSDPNDPKNIVACPGDRGVAANTPCGTDNNHYGDYVEPSWFGGGKRPNLYLSFGPQVGFRFKPIKEFMAKLNLGWNIFAGPFFGLSGSYGL